MIKSKSELLYDFYRAMGADKMKARLLSDIEHYGSNRKNMDRLQRHIEVNPVFTLKDLEFVFNNLYERKGGNRKTNWLLDTIYRNEPELDDYWYYRDPQFNDYDAPVYEYVETTPMTWSAAPLQQYQPYHKEVYMISSLDDVQKLLDGKITSDYEYDPDFANSLTLTQMLRFLKQNKLLSSIELVDIDNLTIEQEGMLSRLARQKRLTVELLLDQIARLSPVTFELDESFLRSLMKTPMTFDDFKQYIHNRQHTDEEMVPVTVQFMIYRNANKTGSKHVHTDIVRVPASMIIDGSLTDDGWRTAASQSTCDLVRNEADIINADYVGPLRMTIRGGTNDKGTCLKDSIVEFFGSIGDSGNKVASAGDDKDLSYLDNITKLEDAYDLVLKHENKELPFINDLGVYLLPCSLKYENCILFLNSHFELVKYNDYMKKLEHDNIRYARDDDERREWTTRIITFMKTPSNIKYVRKIKNRTDFSSDVNDLDTTWLEHEVDKFDGKLEDYYAHWLESYEMYDMSVGWVRYQYVESSSTTELLNMIKLVRETNDSDKTPELVKNTFQPYLYRHRYCRNKNVTISEDCKCASIDRNKAYLTDLKYVLESGEANIYYNIPIDPTRIHNLSDSDKYNCCVLCVPKRDVVMPCGYYTYKAYSNCKAYLDALWYYPLKEVVDIQLYRSTLDGAMNELTPEDYINEVMKDNKYKKLIGSMICHNDITRTVNWFDPNYGGSYNKTQMTHLRVYNYNFKTTNTFLHSNIIMRCNEIMAKTCKFMYEKYPSMTIKAIRTDAILVDYDGDINEVISEVNKFVNYKLKVDNAFKYEGTKDLRKCDNNDEYLRNLYSESGLVCAFGVAGCGKTYSYRNKDADSMDACVIVNNYFLRDRVWNDFRHGERKYPTFVYQQISKNYKQLFHYHSMIVDECFKFNNDELDFIFNVANTNGVTLHLLGDPHQFLPTDRGMNTTQYLSYTQYAFITKTKRNDYEHFCKLLCGMIDEGLSIVNIGSKRQEYKDVIDNYQRIFSNLPIKFFLSYDEDIINDDTNTLKFCHRHKDDNAISDMYEGKMYRCVKTVNATIQGKSASCLRTSPKHTYIRNCFYTREQLSGIENVQTKTNSEGLHVLPYKGSEFIHTNVNKLTSIQGITIEKGQTLYIYGDRFRFYDMIARDTRLLYVILTRFTIPIKELLTN